MADADEVKKQRIKDENQILTKTGLRTKTVSTRYFILIDSKIKNIPENLDKIQLFKKTIEKIFFSLNILNFLKIEVDASKKLPVENVITSIRSVCVGEVGSVMNSLHYHCDIAILHRTRLQIQNRRITKYIIKNVGIVPFVAPPNIIADMSASIFTYQMKDVLHYPKLKISAEITHSGGVEKHFSFKF